MAEIVNLHRARQQRARVLAAARAAAQRALQGRTKAQVARDKADAERTRRALDQARRDD